VGLDTQKDASLDEEGGIHLGAGVGETSIDLDIRIGVIDSLPYLFLVVNESNTRRLEETSNHWDKPNLVVKSRGVLELHRFHEEIPRWGKEFMRPEDLLSHCPLVLHARGIEEEVLSSFLKERKVVFYPRIGLILPHPFRTIKALLTIEELLVSIVVGLLL